jgi:alpha-amylase/alpha-mannosidase (GH57 family)
MHKEKVKQHFGVSPQVFRNTELIYSDYIGEMVADMAIKQFLPKVLTYSVMEKPITFIVTP